MTRQLIAVSLFGGGTAWNMGNAGPIVSPISEEFSVSLGVVGLLSGAALYGTLLAANMSMPVLSKRIGAGTGARTACLLCGVGNLLFALAPTFGVAVGGRLIVGYGVGLALIYGPALARSTAGVRGVGIYGAAVMAGIAVALGLGGVLESLSVDWRWAAAIAALTGMLAVPLLPRHIDVARPGRSERGIAREVVGSRALWRLWLIFLGTLGISVTVGAWLVYYLTVEGDESVAIAGLLSFLIFAVAAPARIIGGQLDHHGVPRRVLIGVAPLLAALGVAALAIEPIIAIALPAAVLMGIGWSLPYAAMFDEAQRVFPKQPLSAIAFASTGANGAPILLIPLIGVLFASNLAELAWLMLAAIVAIGGLANAWMPSRETAPQ